MYQWNKIKISFSSDNLESLILPLELLLIVRRSTLTVLLKNLYDLGQGTEVLRASVSPLKGEKKKKDSLTRII